MFFVMLMGDYKSQKKKVGFQDGGGGSPGGWKAEAEKLVDLREGGGTKVEEKLRTFIR